jgi:nucleotide-binding universal stress UspA family protein
MLKNILMATDFSAASKAALRIGIKLCKSSGAQLHVVHVLPKMDGRVFTVLSHLAQKDMQKFFPSHLYSKNRKEVLFNDSASEAILNYAKKQRCSLIVVGSKNRTGIGNFLAGSIIRPLAQNSTVPLMLVSDSDTIHKIRNILVPFDFSAVSKKALAYAAESAKILSANLHVIYVLDSRISLHLVQLNALRKKIELRLKRAMEKQAGISSLRSNQFTAVALTGIPTEEISKYMRRQSINLVVMGTHRPSGIVDLLVPSTASTILSKTKTPEITILSRTITGERSL